MPFASSHLLCGNSGGSGSSEGMFARIGASVRAAGARGARVVRQTLPQPQLRAPAMRQLSTKQEAAASPASGLKRTVQFLLKHKQSLMNIVAMYFVLSMALHQMRVKKAWDAREEEFDKLKATAEKVEANLTDDEWLDDISQQLRVDRASLEAAIRARIEEAKPKQQEDSFEHLTNMAAEGKDVKIV